MKFIARITLCAFLFFSFAAQAQDSARKTSMTGTYLKYNLGALFDGNAPTYFFSGEFRTREKFGFEVGAGVPVGFSYDGDSIYRKAFKLKTTFRFYPSGGKGYFGLELFGTNVRHNRFNGHFVDENNMDYTYAEGEIKRNILGIAIKGGGIFPIGSHWYLETGGGLGFRYVKSSVSPRNGSTKEPLGGGGIPAATEGFKTTPHINVDLKIAYRL